MLRLVNEELVALAQPRPFYVGVPVCVPLLVCARMITSWADSPERQKLLGLRGGTEFGIGIALRDSLRATLPCNACAQLIGCGKPLAERCSSCSAFDPLRVQQEPPPHYPDPEAETVPVYPLSFDLLRRATTLAYEHLENHHSQEGLLRWTPKQARAFLSTFSMNEATMLGICKCAAARSAAVGGKQDRWMPPSWARNGWLIEQHIEGEQPGFCVLAWLPFSCSSYNPSSLPVPEPMHLLLYGLVKTVFSLVRSWSTASDMQADVESGMTDLAGIAKLKLQWCKVLPVGTLGGWLAENWLGFARIAPWMYDDLGQLTAAGSEPYIIPEGPASTWGDEGRKLWLRACGLSVKSGLPVALRLAHVLNLLELPQPPEPLGATSIGGGDVRSCVRALVCALAHLMLPFADGDTAGVADTCMRAFLARLHLVDKGMRGGVPLLIRKVNLQNAKHLVGVMREHGPLRRHYAGGPMGEGCLRKIKPLFAHVGLRDGWQMSAMRASLEDRAVSQALGGGSEAEQAGDEFRTYANEGAARDAIGGASPVSVAYSSSCECWGIALRGGNFLVVKPVQLRASGDGRCAFFSWVATETAASIGDELQGWLLLPWRRPWKQDRDMSVFWATTISWEELDSNAKISTMSSFL